MPVTRRKDWSGRGDLNSRPPAPKAGGLSETTILFSTFLLKQNNLVVILACGWLCANVPICLLGGHKSWHNWDGARSPAAHTCGKHQVDDLLIACSDVIEESVFGEPNSEIAETSLSHLQGILLLVFHPP
jgi:hypothetical protein